MVTGLDPAKEARYRELHQNPWPSIIAILKRHNFSNYSIHLITISGKPYLFGYLEYTGDDYDADTAAVAAEPETQRWWKETDPCQIPLPEAAAQNEIWQPAEEVFYMP